MALAQLAGLSLLFFLDGYAKSCWCGNPHGEIVTF